MALLDWSDSHPIFDLLQQEHLERCHCINAFSNNPIKTLIDHSSDRSSVSLEESIHCCSVPLSNAIKENQRLRRRVRRFYGITEVVICYFKGTIVFFYLNDIVATCQHNRENRSKIADYSNQAEATGPWFQVSSLFSPSF